MITETFDETKKHRFPPVIEALDEIFITYSTLLILRGREDDATYELEKAKEICKYFEKFIPNDE